MEHNWPQLLKDHGPAVWRLLSCMLGHDADARDCYQTVFLEAFQLAKRQPIENWEKLLKRIARSRAIDTLRKRYRAAERIDPVIDPGETASSLSAPDEDALAMELADQLRRGLALLSPQQAEVFVMRFVEQMNYDQIAERTGSNRNAVGAMLSRARSFLREFLEAESLDAIESRRNGNDQ